MKQKPLLDQEGLRLSRQALRVLKERGIFAHSPVSLQHQHLAKRYVVRGLESADRARQGSTADAQGRCKRRMGVSVKESPIRPYHRSRGFRSEERRVGKECRS